MTYAQDERAALAALLHETGPDGPTLCEGWQTRDLAAHLALRARRPGLPWSATPAGHQGT
jgi:uncharacterized protein (TIGR03083 family)